MKRIGLIAACAALVALALALLSGPRWLGALWLAAALLPLGLSLGAIGLLFIHTLTGGRWGEALGPAWRALLPLWIVGAAAIAPLLIEPEAVFPWADGHARLPGWFSAGTLALRTGVAFIVLAGLHLWALKPTKTRATAGLILWLPTLTLLAVDWIGGRDPHWYSSGFGATVAGFFMLGALAASIVLADRDQAPRRDLGNLLLAATLFWVYVMFMEYLIIWIADLPHEAGFYLRRSQGWTLWLTPLFVLLMGAIPFGMMLFRAVKCSERGLQTAAGSVLAGGVLYMLWLVAP